MSVQDATPARRTPIEVLAGTRMFSRLDRSMLAEVAAHAIITQVSEGTVLFRQGDPGNTFHVVIEGQVRIFITSPEGDDMVLANLRALDSFGEVALLDGQPRSASAEAVEATTLLSLHRDRLLGLLRSRPDLMEAMLAMLGATVRRLTERTSDLAFLDLHERVAKMLLGLLQERGEGSPDGQALDLHLTENDLAAAVGGSFESVHRILRSFEQLGHLEMREGMVVVRDARLLVRTARDGISWAELADKVFHDPLTQLANRALFNDRLGHALGHALSTGDTIAVAIVDINDFKSVNDTYGQAEGDRLLRVTSSRLRSCIREPDTAGRLGTDEFGLLLMRVERTADVERVALRVIEGLAAPLTRGDAVIAISVNVGIALSHPGDAESATELMIRAGRAVLQAKRAGRGRYSIDAAAPADGEAAAAS